MGKYVGLLSILVVQLVCLGVVWWLAMTLQGVFPNSAVVEWMERGPEVAEIRVRRVSPDGGASSAAVVTTTSSGRDSGFPQMIQDQAGRIVFAWVQTGEPGQIRMARTQETFE